MKKRSLGLLIAACVASLPFSASAITLQELYDQALLNEHQLKADEARYKAGQEAKNQSRAGLLPQLTGNAGYLKQDTRGLFINPTTNQLELGRNVQEFLNYSVTLNQPLFNANTWFSFQQGKQLSKQSGAQFAADQQAFILRIAEGYFSVLRAVEVLDTARAQEKALQQQLEQTKQRFEVGLTAITDVHDAQASYDSARANSLVNQNSLGVAYENLEVLSGSLQNSVIRLSDTFPIAPPEPSDKNAWVSFALKNNNSLKAAKIGAKAAKQASKAATSGHLPTLDFQAQHSDSNLAGVGNAADRQTNTFSVNLNVPIFSGGRVSAARRQAAQQYEQAQQTYLQTKRSTMQNARSQHLTVVSDVATIKARKQAIVSSESSLEATQAGYEVGTRDFVDVLNAQQRVFQSKSDYFNALYDYILNTLRLKQTAGTLSPQDISDLDRWLDKSKTVDWNSYNTL